MFELPDLTPPPYPLFLELPPIKSEEVGSYEHPALTRYIAFQNVHGKKYEYFVLSHVKFVMLPNYDLKIFAFGWIHLRLSELFHNISKNHRLYWAYQYLLHNENTQAFREIIVLSMYRERKHILAYLEMHLAYRYDACTHSVCATGRHAYEYNYYEENL